MIRFSCGVRVLRTILCILNIIFLLFGLTILGLGIYIKVDGNFRLIIAAYNITQVLGGVTMQWIGTILIIVGVLTSCLAAFGCLGAICHNRTFLYLYATLLSLVIIVEFGSVLLILIYRNDLWKSYDSSFEEIFENAYHHNQTETIDLIEQIEKEFQCCGVNSYIDYINLNYQIPKSCYPNQISSLLPFNQGCATRVVVWVWNKLPILAGILGIILFIEIFGIISSLILGITISHTSTKSDDCYELKSNSF